MYENTFTNTYPCCDVDGYFWEAGARADLNVTKWLGKGQNDVRSFFHKVQYWPSARYELIIKNNK